MFEFLRRWFGLAKRPVTDDRLLAMRYDRLADVPGGDALHEKTAAVCRGRQLVLTTDGTLPQRLASGETCWVLPTDDVALPVQMTVGNRTIQAEVRLRFEADHAFALFAFGRDRITKDELAQLVAGQWSELMTLERLTCETLLSGDADVLARFRTHLSLLMQENGFRCVGIETITQAVAESAAPQAALPEAVPALPNEAASELHTAITKVKTEKDWETLLDQLDDAGFEPDMQAMSEIATLGDDYLARKVSSDEAALKIRKMIERKNLELAAIQRETGHWNAADVKLRLLETFDEDAESELLAAAGDLPKGGRVPGTWYMLRKHKIDAKLQKYLQSATDDMLKLLDSVRIRQSDVVAKSKLGNAHATLKRIRDHLAMMPTLVPKQRELKRKQRDWGDLLAAVRRSVGAAQLAAGLLRKLATDDYSPKEYENAVRDLENALDVLENELRERKKVYGG